MTPSPHTHPPAPQLRAAAKQALQRRQWARARELLDEAVELAPGLYPLYRLRVIASAGLGDFESALEGRCLLPCCLAALLPCCLAALLPCCLAASGEAFAE
jgi:hypothetical protein